MGLSNWLISAALELGKPQVAEAIALPELAQLVQPKPGSLIFRTKHYVVEIIWRRGQPYLTVSNNGFRVIVNSPARMTSARGTNDRWTTYTANSADYSAVVRVSPTGERVIEVRQVGQRIVQEYAMGDARPQSIPSTPESTRQLTRDLRETNLLNFQTEDYVVRVYRQKQDLYMNLYNKRNRETDLKRVPVTRVETSEATIYRFDGDATIQAREDYRGQRVLLILRDNAIQYRGDGY